MPCLPLRVPWTRPWSQELHSIWQCAQQQLKTVTMHAVAFPVSFRCITECYANDLKRGHGHLCCTISVNISVRLSCRGVPLRLLCRWPMMQPSSAPETVSSLHTLLFG